MSPAAVKVLMWEFSVSGQVVKQSKGSERLSKARSPGLPQIIILVIDSSADYFPDKSFSL